MASKKINANGTLTDNTESHLKRSICDCYNKAKCPNDFGSIG